MGDNDKWIEAGARVLLRKAIRRAGFPLVASNAKLWAMVEFAKDPPTAEILTTVLHEWRESARAWETKGDDDGIARMNLMFAQAARVEELMGWKPER